MEITHACEKIEVFAVFKEGDVGNPTAFENAAFAGVAGNDDRFAPGFAFVGGGGEVEFATVPAGDGEGVVGGIGAAAGLGRVAFAVFPGAPGKHEAAVGEAFNRSGGGRCVDAGGAERRPCEAVVAGKRLPEGAEAGAGKEPNSAVLELDKGGFDNAVVVAVRIGEIEGGGRGGPGAAVVPGAEDGDGVAAGVWRAVLRRQEEDAGFCLENFPWRVADGVARVGDAERVGPGLAGVGGAGCDELAAGEVGDVVVGGLVPELIEVTGSVRGTPDNEPGIGGADGEAGGAGRAGGGSTFDEGDVVFCGKGFHSVGGNGDVIAARGEDAAVGKSEVGSFGPTDGRREDGLEAVARDEPSRRLLGVGRILNLALTGTLAFLRVQRNGTQQ